MILRLVIGLSVLVGINIWFLLQLFSHVSIPASDAMAVAKVKEMYGKVMVRSAAQVQWREMTYDTELRVGDVVFVGDKSKLVYRYRREKGSVSIPSDSIFEVTKTPMISSKIFRTFYKTSSIGERKVKKGESLALRKRRIYVKMEQAPLRDSTETHSSNDAKDSEDESGVASLSVERMAKALRVIEPKGNLTVFSRQVPISFVVRLEKPATVKKIFGYLWAKNGAARPVWSSIIEGNVFENVTVSSPGEYVFQAVTEDDEYVSPLIIVTVVQPASNDQEKLISEYFSPESMEGKRVLVLR